MITVEGTLKADAQHGTRSSDHVAVVTMLIDIGPGFPIEARVPYGLDGRLAERVADCAKKGCLVRVMANGVMLRMDHGVAAVLLHDIREAHITGRQVFPSAPAKRLYADD